MITYFTCGFARCNDEWLGAGCGLPRWHKSRVRLGPKATVARNARRHGDILTLADRGTSAEGSREGG